MVRQQAITWDNVELDLCRQSVSQTNNVLNICFGINDNHNE